MLILQYLEIAKNRGGGHSDSAQLVELLRVTSFAILEVFLLCIVGYILGRKGIVDSKAKRTLNKLNQNLLTPCLLAGKVMFTLNPQKLAELWIVPVGFVVVSGLSALIAWGMGTIFRLSKSQRAFAIACATFMNSNSLPIALMQSLVYTVDALKWGPGDTKDAMLGRALSYLVLFSTLGIILRWSYGIKLLSTADDQAPKEDPEESVENGHAPAEATSSALETEQGYDASAPLLGTIDENGESNGNTPKKSRFSDGPVTIARPPVGPLVPRRMAPVRRWTALGTGEDIEDADFFHASLADPNRSRSFRKEISQYRSFPNTPSRTPAASSYASSEDDADEDREGLSRSSSGPFLGGDTEDDYIGIGRRNNTEQSRSAFQATLRRTRRKVSLFWRNKIWKPISSFLKGVQAFMTAPLYAALLSLVVACIPPLQRLLSELLPLRNAIKSAGNCSVPITLIVLGSYFVEEPDPAAEAKANEKKSKRKSALRRKASTTSSFRQRFSAWFNIPGRGKEDDDEVQAKMVPGESRTVFVSVASRMIVAPLVMIPLLAWWSIKTNNIADDPIFIVTAVLVITSAPAITLAQMTQASGASFERLISKTLFYSYVLVTFPTVIAAVLVGLEIAERQ